MVEWLWTNKLMSTTEMWAQRNQIQISSSGGSDGGGGGVFGVGGSKSFWCKGIGQMLRGAMAPRQCGKRDQKIMTTREAKNEWMQIEKVGEKREEKKKRCTRKTRENIYANARWNGKEQNERRKRKCEWNGKKHACRSRQTFLAVHHITNHIACCCRLLLACCWFYEYPRLWHIHT